MGKKSPSPPPAPDPVATAAAQGKENRETAIANLETSLIDQYTPTGSLVYRPAGSTFGVNTAPVQSRQFDQAGYDAAVRAASSSAEPYNYISVGDSQKPQYRWSDGRISLAPEPTTGGTVNRDDFYRTVTSPGGAGGTTANGNPRYEAVQTLTPDQQRILDLGEQASIGFGETANRQLSAVSDRLAAPFDLSQFGERPNINEDTRQTAYQSILDRDASRQAQSEEALRTRLANQGFGDPSSEAYRAEMDNLYRGQNDFALGAQQAALGQASQLYGLETDRYNRRIQDEITERGQPLNELTAMLSGTQVTSPSFVPTPTVNAAPAPVADAVYSSFQGQMNNYNQQVAQQNARTQGLYSLLGAGAGAAGSFFSFR